MTKVSKRGRASPTWRMPFDASYLQQENIRQQSANLLRDVLLGGNEKSSCSSSSTSSRCQPSERSCCE
eukprot:CAMPEP_0182821780 /NCGR_PEP_ID=MMETSP0006_2-20121128/13856_1 /TAXON_ID=97485 /ORGANISM="Prymnesium parvum, Strain Texoma1" /LENGTH=67 /DNA_ID=CAMNT_0024948567 /DNA_START=519 /DNA_END=722 /DNA_ORIENTATION=-